MIHNVEPILWHEINSSSAESAIRHNAARLSAGKLTRMDYRITEILATRRDHGVTGKDLVNTGADSSSWPIEYFGLVLCQRLLRLYYATALFCLTDVRLCGCRLILHHALLTDFLRWRVGRVKCEKVGVQSATFLSRHPRQTETSRKNSALISKYTGWAS